LNGVFSNGSSYRRGTGNARGGSSCGGWAGSHHGEEGRRRSGGTRAGCEGRARSGQGGRSGSKRKRAEEVSPRCEPHGRLTGFSAFSISRLWKKNRFAWSQAWAIRARSTRTLATTSGSWLSIFSRTNADWLGRNQANGTRQ